MDKFNRSLLLPVKLQCEEYLAAAKLLLEAEDIRGAMARIRDCEKLIQTQSSSLMKTALDVKWRACRSHIFEVRNKYLAASYNYFEISMISYSGDDAIASQEISNALDNGIKCVILAQHSTHRVAVLRRLMNDERVPHSLGFRLIQCFHEQRIISKSMMEDYAKTLSLKDQMKCIGNWTVLQQSVYQHNMRSLANMYSNISFEDAAVLLDLSETEVEDIARGMMLKKQLKGSIDQIDAMLTFDNNYDGLHSFDSNIEEFLKDLEFTAERINDLRSDSSS